MGDDKQLNYVHTEPLAPQNLKDLLIMENLYILLKNAKYCNKEGFYSSSF